VVAISRCEIEEKVKEFLFKLLSNKKLAKIYSFKTEFKDKVDEELLFKLLNEPEIIHFDEDNEQMFIVNEAGERINCPSIEAGVTDSSEWISEFLPMIPIDLEQGGNVRKSAEAENMYKSLLIAGIIKGEFLEQIKRVIANYNYVEMKGEGTGENFTELLGHWQSLQSLTIRVITTAANYKITGEKKGELGFAHSSLTRDETIGVLELRREVKSVIRGYMEGGLSPDNVKKLEKIDRLKLIQQKDNEVRSVIEGDDKYSGLYKICAMTTDYLGPTVKLKLSESAMESASESAYLFKDDENSYLNFVSTLKRSAYKESLLNLKLSEIENWRKLGNKEYRLRSKL
jgi:hypothetical protein